MISHRVGVIRLGWFGATIRIESQVVRRRRSDSLSSDLLPRSVCVCLLCAFSCCSAGCTAGSAATSTSSSSSCPPLLLRLGCTGRTVRLPSPPPPPQFAERGCKFPSHGFSSLAVRRLLLAALRTTNQIGRRRRRRPPLVWRQLCARALHILRIQRATSTTTTTTTTAMASRLPPPPPCRVSSSHCRASQRRRLTCWTAWRLPGASAWPDCCGSSWGPPDCASGPHLTSPPDHSHGSSSWPRRASSSASGAGPCGSGGPSSSAPCGSPCSGPARPCPTSGCSSAPGAPCWCLAGPSGCSTWASCRSSST